MGVCRDSQTTHTTLGLNSVRKWRLHGLWLAFLEFRSEVDVSYNDDGLVVTVLAATDLGSSCWMYRYTSSCTLKMPITWSLTRRQ